VNGEGEFEEEVFEQSEDASARDVLNADAATNGILRGPDNGLGSVSFQKVSSSFFDGSSGAVCSVSRSPQYEVLQDGQENMHHSDKLAHSNLHQSSPVLTKKTESLVSFASPRSSSGIAASSTFAYNASAAPGDPVSQALLKKLFAIEQSVAVLQAQIVKCLAADDASVCEQLHDSNSQVEKLMRIRSEVLVALQHQQQIVSSSPKVSGASSARIAPLKNKTLPPLGHSFSSKSPLPAATEHGYMSDNASSTTLSASSRTNGDFTSSVSHSALSDDM
jgi:hypothetical protein